MMKFWLITALLFICLSYTYSQTYDLSNMHGLVNNKGEILLEISGYEIYIGTFKGDLAKEKTVNSIKKKYELQTILAEYFESSLPVANKIIEAESYIEDRPYVKANQICFLLKKSEKEITVILFQTLNQRDTVLEKEILERYLKDGLKDYVTDDWTASKITFAGREIELGSACKWKSPHNIYCYGGQISWSEFPDFDSALSDINMRVKANDNEKLLVLSDDEIEIIFEDIPTIALRVVYMEKSGYENFPLIVYYVAQEVRGRYLSCTLSHYGYNRHYYELPSLLQQIMSVPSLPEDAFNEFDIPEYEDLPERREKNKDDINIGGVKAGGVIPIGGLTNVFKWAPVIELYAGYPIKRNLAIDLGVSLAFPVKKSYFEYYRGKEIYDTKTNLMLALNARLRSQHKLAENVYINPYLGFGVNALQTDIEYDTDEGTSYRAVETLDAFGGINLRYKMVGLFAEYHYTPYSIGGKVLKSLGNSWFNMGISVSF